MMVKDKIELVKKLYTLRKVSNNYLDNIPMDINAAFFDNCHTNNLELSIDFLINAYFGKYAEDIFWFLGDWQPGFEIVDNGVRYIINTEDDFYKFLETTWQD